MSGYQIITDATADLTEAWANQIGVEIIPMECQLGGVPYTFGPGGNITGEEFFAGMRGGKMGSTSQINPRGWTYCTSASPPVCPAPSRRRSSAWRTCGRSTPTGS